MGTIEADIDQWILRSTQEFQRLFVNSADRKAWVLKFINARFLGAFFADKRLAISATPGFTWGDGVYVTPLATPYSSMMYGRAGIMGFVPEREVRRAYDAASPRGIELYIEWIQHSAFLFRTVMTTVHSSLANRLLRNFFKRRFAVDVVWFAPDQLSSGYVDHRRDKWLAFSDWAGVGPLAPGQRPRPSTVVKGCEWVAIVGEQFEEGAFGVHFNALFDPWIARPVGSTRRAIVSDLQAAYTSTAAGAPQLVLVEP